jgi:hypothetical protein
MKESAINPNINDQYPIPGDNDSQVFRDNFATIKNSLSSARLELSDLLSSSLRTDSSITNLNSAIVSNQILKNTSIYKHVIAGLKAEPFDVDYDNGMYQTVQIIADVGINLKNFPIDSTDIHQVGRLRLHVSADRTSRKIEFTSSDAVIKYQPGFPFVNSTKINIPGSGGKDPVIFDIWQVNNKGSTPTIYIKYVGQFVFHAITQPPTPVSYSDDVLTVINANSTLLRTNDNRPGINVGIGLSLTPILYVNGIYKESIYNSTTGTLTPINALETNTYQFSYTLADELGNEDLRSQPLTIEIDTTPPPTPSVAPPSYVDDVTFVTGLTSTALRTNDNVPQINIVSGLTDSVKLYGNNIFIPSTYNAMTGRITPSNELQDGTYAFTYTLSDDVDNESGKSPAINIIIDTVPPSTGSIALTADTGSSSSDGITYNGEITVNGLESGSTWEYSIDSGINWTTGSGSSVFTLLPGTYAASSIKVRQTDIAGNLQISHIATNAGAITVDTTAPSTGSIALTADTGVSSTDGITKNIIIAVSGLDNDTTWQYSYDSGTTWTAGTGTTFSLQEGIYAAGVIKVRQTDVAGNIQTNNIPTNSAPVTIDTTAPATGSFVLTTDSGPSASDGITNNGTITVSGLETGVTWEYTTNGGSTWLTGIGSSFKLTSGTYAANSIKVRQTDKAGNVQTDSIPSNSATIIVYEYPPTVITPTTYNDDVTPVTSLTSSAIKTNDPTPGINIGTTIHSTALYVDNIFHPSDYDPVTGTLAPSTNLSDNTYEFTYKLTDLAGNVSLMSPKITITIDTAAPASGSLALAVDDGVSSSDGNSTNGAITVSGLESGATWEYSINSGITWSAGSGSAFTLANGTYNAGTIKVRQIDGAGNVQNSSMATNAITYTIAPAPPPPQAPPPSVSPVIPGISASNAAWGGAGYGGTANYTGGYSACSGHNGNGGGGSASPLGGNGANWTAIAQTEGTYGTGGSGGGYDTAGVAGTGTLTGYNQTVTDATGIGNGGGSVETDGVNNALSNTRVGHGTGGLIRITIAGNSSYTFTTTDLTAFSGSRLVAGNKAIEWDNSSAIKTSSDPFNNALIGEFTVPAGVTKINIGVIGGGGGGAIGPCVNAGGGGGGAALYSGFTVVPGTVYKIKVGAGGQGGFQGGSRASAGSPPYGVTEAPWRGGKSAFCTSVGTALIYATGGNTRPDSCAAVTNADSATAGTADVAGTNVIPPQDNTDTVIDPTVTNVKMSSKWTKPGDDIDLYCFNYNSSKTYINTVYFNNRSITGMQLSTDIRSGPCAEYLTCNLATVDASIAYALLAVRNNNNTALGLSGLSLTIDDISSGTPTSIKSFKFPSTINAGSYILAVLYRTPAGWSVRIVDSAPGNAITATTSGPALAIYLN